MIDEFDALEGKHLFILSADLKLLIKNKQIHLCRHGDLNSGSYTELKAGARSPGYQRYSFIYEKKRHKETINRNNSQSFKLKSSCEKRSQGFYLVQEK